MTEEKLTACKDCENLVWEWEHDYYYTKRAADAMVYAARVEKSMHLRDGHIPNEIIPVCCAKTKQAFDPVNGRIGFVARHTPCITNNPDGHCTYFQKRCAIIRVPHIRSVPWYRRWFGKTLEK